jgi:hypothetical protein
MRGGDLKTPDDYPSVGFFDFSPLPNGLSSGDRRQMEQALRHPGGPPHMEREGLGLGARLDRLFGGRTPRDKDLNWTVEVKLVIAAEGQISRSRTAPGEPWRLPMTHPAGGEAPWEAGIRLLEALRPGGGGRLNDLRLVELARDRLAITFVFAASLYGAPIPHSSSEMPAFVQAGQLMDGFSAEDAAIVERVIRTAASPLFRLEGDPN